MPGAPPWRDVAEAAPGYPEAPPVIQEVRPIVVAPPLPALAATEIRLTDLERQQELIDRFKLVQTDR